MHVCILLVLIVCFSNQVHADYSQHKKAQPLISELVTKHGFTREEVVSILADATTEQRILDSMTNAAEKTKTWTSYRSSFLSVSRIEKGAAFLQKHRSIFDSVEKNYGVPAEVITAILGVETNFGSYTGKANVLNALATLGFEHPRRGRFFKSELLEYILLCKEQNWNPAAQQGSYAGAMGMSQFMPSNYRRLAVDGNNDGKVDLFEVTDAIHSIANYLQHHGWRKGEIIASRVRVEPNFDVSKIGKGLKPNYSISDLAKSGYVSQNSVDDTLMARIVRFNDADGDEFWLGFQNFYSISRYNPRSKYAMAVYLLSEEILSAYTLLGE